jgi:hypothetical protein
MGLLSRFTGLFTRRGRDDNTLLEALEHAKAKRLQKAVDLYSELLNDRGTNATVRARALFNRALAHSAMHNDDQGLADLEELLARPDVPENVKTAARAQIYRVRRRSEA